MHITVFPIDRLPDADIVRWNALLARSSPVKSAFLSYAFAKAVQDVRGGVSVIRMRGDGGEEGYLPIQIRRGRKFLGHAEKVGAGMSDFFGMIGSPTIIFDADDLLRAAGISSLRFDHALREQCPFAFDEAEAGSGARLHVDSFEKFKSGLMISNKKFVQSVLSRERRLAGELGAITFRWQSDDPARALDQLISAKRNQYRRTGVTDALATGWHRALLERLLESSAPECTAIVSTLEAGGNWVGSKFSLICGDTLHSWFSVYDPLCRRHGPGHLVWFKTIEEGSRRGIRTFDFGEGEANYKAEYGGESYEVFKGVIRRGTWKGRSERALQAIIWRLEKARRRVAMPPDRTAAGRDE
jgi:CelD/BcsL family acetyltransferase involved in cellulose biosynthesis